MAKDDPTLRVQGPPASGGIGVSANDRQRLFLLVHVMQLPSPDQADRDAKRRLLSCFNLGQEADDLSFQGGGAQASVALDRSRWESVVPRLYIIPPAVADTLDRVLAVGVTGAFGWQLGKLGAALADGRRQHQAQGPIGPPIAPDQVPEAPGAAQVFPDAGNLPWPTPPG